MLALIAGSQQTNCRESGKKPAGPKVKDLALSAFQNFSGKQKNPSWQGQTISARKESTIY